MLLLLGVRNGEMDAVALLAMLEAEVEAEA